MNYDEYMKSQQWRDLRDECKENAGGKCEFCGQQAYTAHHVKYPKDFANDSIDNLVSVCGKCHRLAHGIKEKTVKLLSMADDKILVKAWENIGAHSRQLESSVGLYKAGNRSLVVSKTDQDGSRLIKQADKISAAIIGIIDIGKGETIELEPCFIIWRVKNE